jgi:hypothetical protein
MVKSAKYSTKTPIGNPILWDLVFASLRLCIESAHDHRLH